MLSCLLSRPLPPPAQAWEEERAARAARREGLVEFNALGAAARRAARLGEAGGGAWQLQLARDLRGAARDLAAYILLFPTRRDYRRAARERVLLARREARLARRRPRKARVAGDEVRARLRAALGRERAARARGGRCGAGQWARGRREGARLARTTGGLTEAWAARVQTRAAAAMEMTREVYSVAAEWGMGPPLAAQAAVVRRACRAAGARAVEAVEAVEAAVEGLERVVEGVLDALAAAVEAAEGLERVTEVINVLAAAVEAGELGGDRAAATGGREGGAREAGLPWDGEGAAPSQVPRQPWPARFRLA